MTDTEGGEAAIVETAPPAAVEASQPERDWETEARKMGNWTPKEEWKGDPANWKDAKTYVEHGENIIRLTSAEVAKVDKKWSERFEKLERVNKTTLARVTADYEERLAALSDKRREAVEAGDTAAFDKADKAIEALKKDAPKADDVPANADPRETLTRDAQAFIDANPWYLEEPEIAAFVDHWTDKYGAAHPELSFRENMAKGVEAAQRKFPDKFGKTAANGHAAVDPGGAFNNGAPSRSEDQIELNKLPNEARVQCKADMAKFPKIYPTVKSWTKEYN